MARDYELVLMLDPAAPDDRREQVTAETRSRIESAGTLKHADGWGTRKLAFEIRQRTEADYRFFRFAAESELLEQLDHALKITDGVLRFRIFKVDEATPMIAPPPTAQPAGVSARASRAESRRAEAEAAEREAAGGEGGDAEPAPVAAAGEAAEPEPEAPAGEPAAAEETPAASPESQAPEQGQEPEAAPAEGAPAPAEGSGGDAEKPQTAG